MMGLRQGRSSECKVMLDQDLAFYAKRWRHSSALAEGSLVKGEILPAER
jgi:hypothetical protein